MSRVQYEPISNELCPPVEHRKDSSDEEPTVSLAVVVTSMLLAVILALALCLGSIAVGASDDGRPYEVVSE